MSEKNMTLKVMLILFKDMPNSDIQCGPYDVPFNPSIHGNKVQWGPGHHDTIGIIAQDSEGNIAAAG